jgi:hypothetical protein
MYEPTLVEVPLEIPLETYWSYYPQKQAPILDQGTEGACTGFGLAAVANFLLRRRKVYPDPSRTSPRMFYEMARRYDEWPGEKYSGSSARGAMKGWYKHGVCTESLWPNPTDHSSDGALTYERARDAARRPLGSYFRVNHRDVVALHSALTEVGILYASAMVHEGWNHVDATGVIPFTERIRGGHAFALVGFDEHGFWLQNSWGKHWGKKGFALITYEDWLTHGADVWVARLGAPISLPQTSSKRNQARCLGLQAEWSFSDLRPHLISIGNNGRLRNSGTFANTPADVEAIFRRDIPRLTADWPKKRILLYAHGGLVKESEAIQRIADYLPPLLQAQVYPLAFVWKTDFWTTLTNILKDAIAKRRPEGLLDQMKDFMLDRLDDTLEPIARPIGKTLWDEMKENALASTGQDDGGARLVIGELARWLDRDPAVEVHIAAHSAGSIFLAPVTQWLTSQGNISTGPARGLKGMCKTVKSVSLWAPACTLRLFHEAYLPAIQNQSIARFGLYTLRDSDEQNDHCAHLYHKSLLYLVSHAFEQKARLWFGQGEPLLGLEKCILADPSFQIDAHQVGEENPAHIPICGRDSATWIRSPNGLPAGSFGASKAKDHGDFDDDDATVRSTLTTILGCTSLATAFEFRTLESALGDRRRGLE